LSNGFQLEVVVAKLQFRNVWTDEPQQIDVERFVQVLDFELRIFTSADSIVAFVLHEIQCQFARQCWRVIDDVEEQLADLSARDYVTRTQILHN
jgi:hypothetical protein